MTSSCQYYKRCYDEQKPPCPDEYLCCNQYYTYKRLEKEQGERRKEAESLTRGITIDEKVGKGAL